MNAVHLWCGSPVSVTEHGLNKSYNQHNFPALTEWLRVAFQASVMRKKK